MEYTSAASSHTRSDTDIGRQYQALFRRSLASTLFLAAALGLTVGLGHWQYPRVIYVAAVGIAAAHAFCALRLAYGTFFLVGDAHVRWSATLIPTNLWFTPQLLLVASWMQTEDQRHAVLAYGVQSAALAVTLWLVMLRGQEAALREQWSAAAAGDGVGGGSARLLPQHASGV